MGREVSAFAASDETVKIVAGVDRAELATEYPVYADFSKLTKESADVLIDFSVAPAVDAVLDFASARRGSAKRSLRALRAFRRRLRSFGVRICRSA